MKKLMTMAGLACALAQSATPTQAAPTEAEPPAPATAPARPPRHPEPWSTTAPDNTRYLNLPKLLTGCTAQVAAIKGKPCDIIFIGDSITAGWLSIGKVIWAQSYAPRHALDFGIGGDKTENVLWRLDNMDIKDLKPKVAVILIGTNNTRNTPQQIADGVKAVITKTQATFAGVKIILVSIMPNKRAHDKMMAVNTIIQGYADSQSVYWLDLVPLMPPVESTTRDGKPDMNWKGLRNDHLHPDSVGYRIWADAMEPLLTKLLAESK